MSEKRFELKYDNETLVLFDTLTNRVICTTTNSHMVDLLNLQEQVINDKNKEIKILEQKIRILREEIQSTKQILKMQVDKLEGY